MENVNTPADLSVQAANDFAEFEAARNAGKIPGSETAETADENTSAAADGADKSGDDKQAKTDGESETPEQAEKRASRNRDRRINRLTAKAYRLEAENEQLRKLIPAVSPAGTETPAPAAAAATSPNGKPTLEQFDYDLEKYEEALIDWKVAEREKLRDIDTKAEKAVEAREAAETERATKVAEFKSAHPDYDKVVSETDVVFQSQAVLDAVIEAGPAIIYKLAQDADLADEIAAMTPTAAIRAIGRLEASLTASTPTPKPRVSNAPPPPARVGDGASSTRARSFDDPDIPFDEFERLRNAQQRR